MREHPGAAAGVLTSRSSGRRRAVWPRTVYRVRVCATANRCAIVGPLRCNCPGAQPCPARVGGGRLACWLVLAPNRRRVAGFRHGRPGPQSSMPLSSWRSTHGPSSAEPPPLISAPSSCWTPSRWHCGCAAGRNTRPGQAWSTAATQDRSTPACRSPPLIRPESTPPSDRRGPSITPWLFRSSTSGCWCTRRSSPPRWRTWRLHDREER